MENMLYESLPAKLKATRSIKRQPFYGRDRADFVIEYIYSHAFWYAGNHAGFHQVRGRCAEEVVAMYDKHPELLDYAGLIKG